MDVARANLKANRLPVKDIVVADISEMKVGKPYDLVAANLVTQDLIAFRHNIVPCVAVGGYLVVSGISLANLPLFDREFRDPSLKALKVVKGKEWVAALFQRTEGQGA